MKYFGIMKTESISIKVLDSWTPADQDFTEIYSEVNTFEPGSPDTTFTDDHSFGPENDVIHIDTLSPSVPSANIDVTQLSTGDNLFLMVEINVFLND